MSSEKSIYDDLADYLNANPEEKEKKDALDVWNSVFQEISSISKGNGITPEQMPFAGDVKKFGKGKYFMRVFTFRESGIYEPIFVEALLFFKPKEGNKDGDLIEISTASAVWENGIVKVETTDVISVDRNIPYPFDHYQMATAVKQVIEDDSQGLTRSVLPLRAQTDLKQ